MESDKYSFTLKFNINLLIGLLMRSPFIIIPKPSYILIHLCEDVWYLCDKLFKTLLSCSIDEN